MTPGERARVPSAASDTRGDGAAVVDPRTAAGAGSGAGDPTARPGRIRSLDVVRGVFLLVSITSATWVDPPASFRHAAWSGVTLLDLVFPLFVTLSGCGLAFAYRNRVGWRATLRRFVVLLLAGLAYNAVVAQSVDVATMRFTGPLQTYAVLVAVIGLLHLWARTPGRWAAITAVLAAGHVAFLTLWRLTCEDQALTPACNPSAVVDPAVLGVAHVYAGGVAGHDPEGLVAILGALVTASVGCTAGHLALSHRGQLPWRIVAWAAGALVAALLTAELVEPMKRLWTTPFALGTAALGVLLLAAGIAVMDRPAGRRGEAVRSRVSWPLVAMGRNSLLVYFGSHLLMVVLKANGEPRTWSERAADAVDVVGAPRLSWVVVNILGWMALAALLHRRRIYLRP